MPDDPDQPPTLGTWGGKRVKGTQSADVTLRQRGNSRVYILARLDREGHTYWIEEIRAAKIRSVISPNL